MNTDMKNQIKVHGQRGPEYLVELSNCSALIRVLSRKSAANLGISKRCSSKTDEAASAKLENR